MRAGTSSRGARELHWPAGSRCARSPTLQRPGDRSADVSASARGPCKCTSTRAACARPGPAGHAGPRVTARLPPSDALPPAATALGPRAWPPSLRTLLRCLVRPTTGVPAYLSCAGDGHRRSATPGCVEERRGPPRVRDRPLRLCPGRTPRRRPPPPRPATLQGGVVASRYFRTLGIRKA